MWCIGVLHKFIQQSLNSGLAHVQIMPMACQRFAMVRISDNGPGWKKSLIINQTLFKSLDQKRKTL